MVEGVKDVKVSLGDGLRCAVEVRGHALYADEPTDQGGTDEGIKPSEMLLASLGACTAMTLRMYANHKGWPLEEVRIILEHEWVTRDEWDEWPEGDDRDRLPRIRRRITVSGDLDDEQRDRLLHIARRCPVHRIVTENPAVVDELTAG